jgi:hypothetical protein
MQGWFATPKICIVETGKIIVHERGAMQHFDRGCRASSSPHAHATARQSFGRNRAPPGKIAYRKAAASFGGQSDSAP